VSQFRPTEGLGYAVDYCVSSKMFLISIDRAFVIFVDDGSDFAMQFAPMSASVD